MVLVSSMLAISLFNCKAKKENREDFEKAFDASVASCAAVLIKEQKLDSLVAYNYCSCLLEEYLKIDSTFLFKSNKELDEFYKSYKDAVNLKCDSLLLKD